MSLTILVPIFAAVVGVVMYAAPANAKVNELGRLAFVVGLLWAIYVASAAAR